MSTITIRALQAPLGAEVLGLDLSEPLWPAQVEQIRSALAHHQLLVFREIRISPQQQVARSAQLGTLQRHVLTQFAHPQAPELMVVSNVVENGRPLGLADAGSDWHSDLSYKARPCLGALLHVQEMPSNPDEVGGDTSFADMQSAFDSLDAESQALLAGRQAVHSYVYRHERLRRENGLRAPLTAEQVAAVPPVRHPAVRRHPETGRPSLYVNEGFTERIEGLPDDESRSLLDALHEHSVRPERVYTHRWQPGDLLFWDNRSTIHHAPVVHPPARRTLYRTILEGEVPVG